MNRKGFIDLEFDMETILALAMGMAGGFIGLIVASQSPTGGLFLKLLVFLTCAVGGFFVAKFMFSR